MTYEKPMATLISFESESVMLDTNGGLPELPGASSGFEED